MSREGDASTNCPLTVHAPRRRPRDGERETAGVARQLGLEEAAFDLVLAGSLFKGSPRLVDAVQEGVRPVAPHVRLVTLKAPAVIGGVLLAMEDVAFERERVHEALVASGLALAVAESTPRGVNP